MFIDLHIVLCSLQIADPFYDKRLKIIKAIVSLSKVHLFSKRWSFFANGNRAYNILEAQIPHLHLQVRLLSRCMV
jgi:hypothetical protein